MNPPAIERQPVDILLVDDRPNNLHSLAATLRRDDYRVILASSGEEALAQVLRHDLALILLDVAMPVMDGFQTASLIKQREQSKYIPIIFVTASVYDLEHIFRGYDVGAVDYLRKPLDPHEVRAKVAVFVELFRQRKKLERQGDQLREAEREQERLLNRQAEQRAREEFVALAAHELKTPLTPLRLRAAGLLEELRRGRLPDNIEERIQAIEAATVKLDRIVERLLELPRIGVGAITLEREEVDLGALVRDQVARLAQEGKAAGATVSIAPHGPVIGQWDRLRIEQVIANLLSNAIRFGEGRPIVVELSADERNARLTVRDHGPGIPVEARERVFERFERLVPMEHHGGLGLGLWIVRKIVEAHDGKVTVAGAPGDGAAFTVVLPRSPPSDLRPDPTHPTLH